MSLNWDEMQNKYLRIDKGQQSRVVLSNWRIENKTFKNDDEPKKCLIFDVLKANDIEYTNNPLEWSTANPILALEFKPIIEKAELRELIVIDVILKRGSDGKYVIIDMTPIRVAQEKVE